MAVITKLQHYYLTKTSIEKKEFLQKVLEQAGIAKRTFYNYVKGEINPPKLIAEKIGELSGINPKQLNDEHYRTVQTKI